MKKIIENAEHQENQRKQNNIENEEHQDNHRTLKNIELKNIKKIIEN